MQLPALARSRAIAAILAAAALLGTGCSTDNGTHTPTAPGTGALLVKVNGLPSGASASVVVTGPSGFSQSVAHTASYFPSPTSASIAVAASPDPVSATVLYSKTASSLDLSIGAMYLTQSTQTLTGAVPLVADRDGYLRVFVIANQNNAVAPTVRVRLYANGKQEGSTITIPAPGPSVPKTVDESSLANSWNVPLSGSLIKPGLSILADVDPNQTISESRRNNNSFPVSGTALPLSVKAMSTFYLRFVPVKRTSENLTGGVSAANKDALLVKTVKIHPISGISSDVHATYTSSGPKLIASNSNSAWDALLVEMELLRVSEGSPRNYFGIVKTSYNGGIAGISYIGGNASVGYDGASAVEIISHELGHSWGRFHAPCGINGNTDPHYPYPAGNIGVYGLDVATKTLYPPATAEVMSYCHPQWISDYTYSGVYSWRVVHPSSSDFVKADFVPCVIVWGHITNGDVVLEPSFQLLTHPSLPEKSGAYALRALDANGAQLFALSFDGDTIADADGAGRSFAYAIPLARAMKPIASLELAGPQGSARRVASPGSMSGSASNVSASVRASGNVNAAAVHRVGSDATITWDAQRYPLIVVRDAKTGEILSFARGGAARVETAASDLELTLSDGVASTVMQSHVAP
jgi:hypothetical protein